jgi:hypothetical protein
LLGRASSPFEVPQNRSHQGRAATAGGTIVDPLSLRTGSTVPSGPAVDVSAAPTQPRLLATGLYLGGTGRLDIGARYGIVVDGARLKVMGPFDGSILALERWLYGLTATVAQDRVLIAIGARNTSIALVFGSLSGMSATRLADELQSARDRARSVS